MIIVTLNIREGGSFIKRKRIGHRNQAGKVDVCMLQETKLSSFSLKIAEEFWGSKEVEWTHLDSIGASGGSVILWRKNSIDLIQSFKGMGFVGVKAIVRCICVNFVNIYAPYNSVVRREL